MRPFAVCCVVTFSLDRKQAKAKKNILRAKLYLLREENLLFTIPNEQNNIEKLAKQSGNYVSAILCIGFLAEEKT